MGYTFKIRLPPKKPVSHEEAATHDEAEDRAMSHDGILNHSFLKHAETALFSAFIEEP